MATTVEELVLRFSAETERLSRDLKKVERITDRSGKKAAKSTDRIKRSLNGVSKAAKKAGLALAAAFAGGAALRGLRQTFAAMNDLQTAASGIGITVETIQELRFAFIAVGSDASKVVKVLTDFSKRIGEAKSNLGTLLPFLDEFGIELENVDKTMKTTDQLFNEVADTIAGLTDTTQRAALGNAAFGRAWVDVVNVLKGGSDALQKLRQEARDTGNVLSGDLVKAAAEADAQFNVLLTTLGQNSRRLTIIFAQAMGLVELTTRQTITVLQIEADRLTISLMENEALGSQAVARRVEEILTVETEISRLTAILDDATEAQNANNKAVKTAGELAKELADRNKLMRERQRELTVMLKNRVIGSEEMEEGLQMLDDLIANLDKRFIDLGPTATDSIHLISNAFEDMILDMQNADDHVKQLIASFGRLIIQQFALKFASSIVGFAGFAQGGVQTAGGPMPLKKYASGGIARTPQISLFGEGSAPAEAFVPLPDGRSIPVTIKGESGSMSRGGNTIFQENHFTTDVTRTVQAELLSFMPLIIDATRQAVAADAAGVRA